MLTENAYIPVYVLEDNRAIMLDSGWQDDLPDILQLLEEKNLQLAAILTSHDHPDHVGNHKELKDRFGAKVYMGPFCACSCTDPLNMFATLGGRAGYRVVRDRTGRFCEPDHIIPWKDGEITLEGVTFKTVMTAGHCAEQFTFITPDNVAYLGDAILSPKIIRTVRLPYCACLEPYLEALDKIAQLGCDKYIFAHNGIEEDIGRVIQITKDTVEERLNVLEALADTPMTLDELVRKFLIHTEADLTSWRSVNGVGFNAKTFAGHLVDQDRLKFVLEDGIMKYVRADKAEGKNTDGY
jgi:glyoxylase-like metal-dependent hydrolase (beta-lactamase superfamily II)